jgi:hypothetical protein
MLKKITLIALLCTSLVACDNKPSQEKTEVKPNNTQETPANEPVKSDTNNDNTTKQ